MFALQPYSEVVSTQGESAMRDVTTTFSTLSPNTSFMSFVSGSNSALSSSIFLLASLIDAPKHASIFRKVTVRTGFNIFFRGTSIQSRTRISELWNTLDKNVLQLTDDFPPPQKKAVARCHVCHPHRWQSASVREKALSLLLDNSSPKKICHAQIGVVLTWKL